MTACGWQAAHPREALGWLSLVTVPWWIGGGWAIDLFLGAESREHGDLDIGILRRDAARVLTSLATWEIFEAKGRVLRRLHRGEAPRADANSVWCRPRSTAPWTFELLLDDSVGDRWVYRRSADIRRPLSKALQCTADGIPFLAPEIQLLYKARSLRPCDQADFLHAAPRLDDEARLWLAQSLARTDPGHAWIARLIGHQQSAPIQVKPPGAGAHAPTALRR